MARIVKSKLNLLVFTCLVISVLSSPVRGTFPRKEEPHPQVDEETLKSLASIAGQAIMNSHAYEFLVELCDDIGGRVTGSPQAAQAIKWSVEKMKAIGLQNVHLEPWTLSRGWTRISASAELVAPVRRHLLVNSMGWVGSTPEAGVEAEVVVIDLCPFKKDSENDVGNWSSRILLVTCLGKLPDNRMEFFAQLRTFLKAAQAAHAVAVIGWPESVGAVGMHLTHTGVLAFNAFFDIPVVSMATEDQDLIRRFLDRGKIVRIKLEVQNRVTTKPIQLDNVVGEIPGREHAEQVIVLGAHLDSWDLGEGATDNGFGVAATLGAAEAILASNHKPRRTIRFVLFTGEEQGLLGSLAYVNSHKDEIRNHVAAVIVDGGQGPIVGFSLGGRSDLIPSLQKFVVLLSSFGHLDVDDSTVFDTDTGPFILAGLPGINLDQDSARYKYTHHSEVDTPTYVKPENLRRDTVVMALTSFWISDRLDRLASPWPRAQIERMLKEKKQDTLLKALDLWPFEVTD